MWLGKLIATHGLLLERYFGPGTDAGCSQAAWHALGPGPSVTEPSSPARAVAWPLLVHHMCVWCIQLTCQTWGRTGVGAGIKAEAASNQLPPAAPSVPAMVLSPTLSLGSATASPALPLLPARGSGVGARSSLPLPPHLMR